MIAEPLIGESPLEATTIFTALWGQNAKVDDLAVAGCPWTEVEIDIKWETLLQSCEGGLKVNRKLLHVMVAVLALLALSAPVVVAGGIDDPGGIPLYVIIEVEWDGLSPSGNWTVWGPRWDPVVGGVMLTSCSNCLSMNYDFTFQGKTLQFDEPYVPGVDATPQVRHVVLHDLDGDGVYTGSLSTEHYTWEGTSTILLMDRIDYTVSVENGQVVWFHYLQYEHKKMIE